MNFKFSNACTDLQTNSNSLTLAPTSNSWEAVRRRKIDQYYVQVSEIHQNYLNIQARQAAAVQP